ncbi:hypothetical protein Tco_1550943, partial [Tanacetum coccineum]
FYILAGNPVKEILLKLNLPDHRSILTDLKEHIKRDMEFLVYNDQDDDERTESDNDGDDFVHPKLFTHDDEARKDDEVN